MLLRMNIIIALFAWVSTSYAVNFNYEIESAGQGGQGTYMVKVSTVQGKNDIKIDELKKCAVHGVLFRGFSSSESHHSSQKPLAGSAVVESQYADFFKAFFSKEGTYTQYASFIDSSIERIKISKKEYRIQAIVIVRKDQLRMDLQQAGVLKSLNSGF